MKKLTPVFMLLIMAMLMSVSCKSAPDTQILTEAMEKAETARQMAIDFGSPVFFPDEWEELEAQFKTASEMPISNKAEVQVAADSYTSVAAGYDEILEKSLPLLAQAKEEEILAVREALINTGFTDAFPEYLENADIITLSAFNQYEEKDFYGAKETAEKALSEYETLLEGAVVFLTRREIVDRGFVQYDADNFSKADETAKAAIEEFEAGNREAAIEKAQEALLRYNLVMVNGWTIYSDERRVSAVNERQLALAERANHASREIFREAEEYFNNAESAFRLENFHDAAGNYTDAEAMFMLARKDTEEKRLKAEAAIRLAEEMIGESNEAAMEAERIIEGGVR